jgi:enoyl-[acyl-carrier protein] reductase II
MVVLQTLTYRHPEFSQYREPVHANYKHAIVDARETGTLVLNDVYFHGDREAAPALAGQSAGLIDAVKSAQHIIKETVAQFFAITGRLGGLATAHTFG